MNIPQGSQSFQKLNPHLYSHPTVQLGPCKPPPTAPLRRIRQSTKPSLNRLEKEWWLQLRDCTVYDQSITFKLCNGLRYTCDFFSFDAPAIGELNRPTAWEVKGPWFTDDANAKLKMFAHQYPEIRVILVWKDKAGVWQQQRILA